MVVAYDNATASQRKPRPQQQPADARGGVDSAAGSSAEPPGAAAAPRLRGLLPIAAASLRVGVAHRGRVFVGRVVTPPLIYKGVYVLLEEEPPGSDVVKVAICNGLPAGLAHQHGRAAVAAANKLVGRQGARVAVAEPFFKQFADGSFGVRVDDPREYSVLGGDDEGGPC